MLLLSVLRNDADHDANRVVQSRAVSSCNVRLVTYCTAIEPTSGSCGLGSSSSPRIAPSRFEIVSAGLQLDSSESRQTAPTEFILQW